MTPGFWPGVLFGFILSYALLGLGMVLFAAWAVVKKGRR